jgi:hypothetical protein
MNPGGPEIRLSLLQVDSIPEAFKLTLADISKVFSLRPGGCRLIKIYWDIQLFSDISTQLPGQLNAFFHAYSLDGYKWNHIDSPHTGVPATVGSKIYQFFGLRGRLERCSFNILRPTPKGYH